MRVFRDRRDAGRQLAESLAAYRHDDPILLALPRGGVPVGVEVAAALGVPLDVLVVRKLGPPGKPEHGMGAVAEGGLVYLDSEAVKGAGVTAADIDRILERESREVERQAHAYRGDRPLPSVAGRTVIVIDDGIGTGGTMRAALRALRRASAGRVIVAAPVIADHAARVIEQEAETVVCLERPREISTLAAAYRDFAPVSNDEVARCLGTDAQRVVIAAAGAMLPGTLMLPEPARGLIVFAHGSGSSRKSPRNQRLARELAEVGLATLLFDLLTEEEAEQDRETGELRFDAPLLASRLAAATDWIRRVPAAVGLPIGYFGASTGAAAALIAAAARPQVRAVVSRGGRPDLAGWALDRVATPVLLIVGGEDSTVDVNRSALARLGKWGRLAMVPGATHLFDEPGALDEVSRLARAFFLENLAVPADTPVTALQ